MPPPTEGVFCYVNGRRLIAVEITSNVPQRSIDFLPELRFEVIQNEHTIRKVAPCEGFIREGAKRSLVEVCP
jgi:hypothetical protein